MRRYPLVAERGFAIDPDAVLACVTDRTRLVLLNTPHNPTGAVLEADALQVLLEGLAARHDNFAYLPIIDEAGRDPGWTGKVGFVYEFFKDGTVEGLLGHPVAPDKVGVFLCGNPAMVQGMEDMLAERDFTIHSRKNAGSIYVEKYW